MIRPKTALKYAEAIKEYCLRGGDSCDGCPLKDEYRDDCKIAGEYPMYWKLKEGDANG